MKLRNFLCPLQSLAALSTGVKIWDQKRGLFPPSNEFPVDRHPFIIPSPDTMPITSSAPSPHQTTLVGTLPDPRPQAPPSGGGAALIYGPSSLCWEPSLPPKP